MVIHETRDEALKHGLRVLGYSDKEKIDSLVQFLGYARLRNDPGGFLDFYELKTPFGLDAGIGIHGNANGFEMKIINPATGRSQKF